MKSISRLVFAIMAVACAIHAESVTYTKGSDGSASGQFKNPSKITITADPGLIGHGGLYLQSQYYAIPVLIQPAAGWMAVQATYKNTSGVNVVVPFTGTPGNRNLTINTVIPRLSISLVTVRFATLRLTPGGTPDYFEDITIHAIGISSIETFDENGDGLPEVWERHYFGWENTPAGGDPEGDGLSNLDEYKAQTSPLLKDNPSVGLKVGVTLR